MFEVKNRSEEAWGPLAKCDEKIFNAIINERRERAKDHIKVYLKRLKKLKMYKVSFIRELETDQFEVQAEDDYSVSSAARELFRESKDSMEFKMKPVGKWAGDYEGYDSLRYVKVKS